MDQARGGPGVVCALLLHQALGDAPQVRVELIPVPEHVLLPGRIVRGGQVSQGHGSLRRADVVSAVGLGPGRGQGEQPAQ